MWKKPCEGPDSRWTHPIQEQWCWDKQFLVMVYLWVSIWDHHTASESESQVQKLQAEVEHQMNHWCLATKPKTDQHHPSWKPHSVPRSLQATIMAQLDPSSSMTQQRHSSDSCLYQALKDEVQTLKILDLFSVFLAILTPTLSLTRF